MNHSTPSPITWLRTLLALLALAAAPAWAQTDHCGTDPATSPNHSDNYLIAQIEGEQPGTTVTAAMNWHTGLVWKRCMHNSGGADCEDWNIELRTWNDWMNDYMPKSFAGQDEWWGTAIDYTPDPDTGPAGVNRLHDGTWRLPYFHELKSLSAGCDTWPQVNREVFPYIEDFYFLTGSPFLGLKTHALNVLVNRDYEAAYLRGFERRALLVRAGQPFAPLIDPPLRNEMADTQILFDPIALAPSSGSGTAWGGARISGEGNPEFSLDGGTTWMTQAIISSTDVIQVRMSTGATGQTRSATLALRSAETDGTEDGCANCVNFAGGLAGGEITTLQETTAAFTVTAAQWDITPQAEPASVTTVTCEPVLVPHGTSSTCDYDSASVTTGYHFTHWSINGIDMSDVRPLALSAVTEESTVIAHFALNQYTVTLAADPVSGGTLAVQEGVDLSAIAHGTSLAVTALPGTGWDVADPASFPPQLTCDGSTSELSDASVQPDGSLTFTVTITDHCNVTAYFANQPPGFLAGGRVNALAGGDEVIVPHWASALRSGDAAGVINQALIFDVTPVGTIPGNPGHAQLFAPGGEPSIDAEGTLRFTPGPDIGTAIVSVQLRDDAGTDWGGTDAFAPQWLLIQMTNVETNLSIHADVPATFNFPGDRIAFALTLHNAGPHDAKEAIVTWLPPLALEQVQWLCVAEGTAVCTASGEDGISETINLPAQGTLDFLIQATISAAAPARIANTATVTPGHDQADPDQSDDMTTWEVVIDGVHQDGFE